MKELKWKHDKSKCSCSNKKETKQVNGLEVLTPYPKKRNGLERKLNRYNHIMEFVRTILAFTTLGLQLIIIYRLFN
jgi:hypothetical protein